MRLSLAITVSALLFGSYVVAMPVKRKATDQNPQPELWLPRQGPGEPSGSQSGGQAPANRYRSNSVDDSRPPGLSLLDTPFGSHPADHLLAHGLFFPPHSDHHDPLGLGLGPAAAHDPHHDPFHIPGTQPFNFNFGPTPPHNQHVDHQAPHAPGPEPFRFGQGFTAPHNPPAGIPLQPLPVRHPSLMNPVLPSERLPTPTAQDQVPSGGNGAYRCSKCGHSSPGPDSGNRSNRGRTLGTPRGATGRSSAAAGRSRAAAGPGRSRAAAGRSSAAAGPSNPAAGPTLHPCGVEGCNYESRRPQDVARHQSSRHSDERPFACTVPGCDKRFARNDALKEHLKSKQHSGP